jgi:hypothetical protein
MKPEDQEFESLEQMAAATAAALDHAANHFAFEFFQDNQFRRRANFDRLPTGEHDRIFNELVVANLALIMLILEAPDLRVADELKPFLRDIQTNLPQAHVRELEKLGIAGEHLEIWAKLIEMRYGEYAKDRHSVRAAAMQLESAEKDLDLEDLSKIQLLVPVQAVAIGCHHHVCRGKVEGRDELFKLIVRSLGKFYVQIRLLLEVGKITPMMRARVAWKRLLRSD